MTPDLLSGEILQLLVTVSQRLVDCSMLLIVHVFEIGLESLDK
jgi:hypothetical protein